MREARSQDLGPGVQLLDKVGKDVADRNNGIDISDVRPAATSQPSYFGGQSKSHLFGECGL